MNKTHKDNFTLAASTLGLEVIDARGGFDADGAPLMTFVVARGDLMTEGVIHFPASLMDMKRVLAAKRVRLGVARA